MHSEFEHSTVYLGSLSSYCSAELVTGFWGCSDLMFLCLFYFVGLDLFGVFWYFVLFWGFF